MSNYLRNEGPLPAAALDTLAWINGKDAEIERLREALERIVALTVLQPGAKPGTQAAREIAAAALEHPE